MSKITINYLEIAGRKEEIDAALDKLIAGEIEEVSIIHVVSDDFVELYNVEETTDFNGWQCDWWSEMNYKNNTLAVMGGAYYGTINISIGEDCDSNVY